MFSLPENNEILSYEDSIEISLSDITQQVSVLVGGYDGEKTITSTSFQLSTDEENWDSSVTIDFSGIMNAELFIKGVNSSTGTVEVENE